MRLCRCFKPDRNYRRRKKKHHSNSSTKMAAKSMLRVFWFIHNCFNLLFYILVFTLTNSLENAPSLMPNVTLFGDSNVPNNNTDDYTEHDSTTQPPDYSSTLQPTLISGPLPLSGRLPTPAADGKTS